jgi:hypothetical protein
MQEIGALSPQKTQERYGISQESLNLIQKTAGVSANSQMTGSIGQRPVVYESEAPLTTNAQTQAVSSPSTDVHQMTLVQSEIIRQVKEALNYQALQFDRFRDITDKKFTTLSQDLMEMSMQLKRANSTIERLKDKEEVAESRAALNTYQRGDRPAPSQAIDRTGVAPSDVSIANIFNCSGKRF